MGDQPAVTDSALKELPYYKDIVKYFLQKQMNILVDQMSEEAGEECVIMAVNLQSGNTYHLGSKAGKAFLDDKGDLKSQFLSHCIASYVQSSSGVEDILKGNSEKDKLKHKCSPGITGESHPPRTKNKILKTNKTKHTSIDTHKPTHSNKDISEATVSRSEDIVNDIEDMDERFEVHVMENQDSSFENEAGVHDLCAKSKDSHTMQVGDRNITEKENTEKLKSKNSDKTRTASGTSDSGANICGMNKSSLNESDEDMEETIEVKVEPVAAEEDLPETAFKIELVNDEELGDLDQSNKTADLSRESNQCMKIAGSPSEHVMNECFCQLCGKTFHYKQRLEKHLQLHEIMNERLTSVENDGQFQNGQSKQGNRNINERRRPGGICKICGKEFTSSSGLDSHERRHRDVAPYKCCGKSFFSKANLTRHRCANHNAKRHFKCKICGKKFAINADLNNHQKTHMRPSYKCEICGVTLAYKELLDDHVAAHSGGRKYVCSCRKAFAYRTGLYRHKKSCKFIALSLPLHS